MPCIIIVLKQSKNLWENSYQFRKSKPGPYLYVESEKCANLKSPELLGQYSQGFSDNGSEFANIYIKKILDHLSQKQNLQHCRTNL